MRITWKGLFVCLLVIALPTLAQVNVRYVPARWVSPADGKQLYAAYCASCHGDDLITSTAVKRTVGHKSDLTQISRRYTKDVTLNTFSTIVVGSQLPKHSVFMPEWRSILRVVYYGDDGQAMLAIRNLTDYIVSHQQTDFRTTGVSNQR